MSSFTSKTVRDLYEAYDSVYLKEEEIFLNELLEEVTETVNGLVDEGWDFSENSWENIYESFIDDIINPELEKINCFFTSLNEEVLSEEEINSFLEEGAEGLLGRLTSLLSRGKKAEQAAASLASKAPKPNILQAPLVRPGAPVSAPASSAPLEAPRRPLNVTRPLPITQQQKGGIFSQGWKAATDWLSKQGKAPSAATQASVSSRTQGAVQRLQNRAQAPAARTPSGQQGWPSIGLRDKARAAAKGISDTYSKVKTALTPGSKVKGFLKYGALPVATTGLTAAPFVSAYNLATGRASGLQQLSGLAQGATGHAIQGTAGVLGRLGSPDAPGMYELGKSFRQAGADTQAKVEAKRKSHQGTGRTGITRQVDPTTGKPVYNSYEMEGEESLQEYLAYDKKNDRWYDIDPSGKKPKTEVTPTQTAIDRYNRLKSQAPAPATQPSRNTRIPLDPNRFEREKQRLKGVGNPPPTTPVAPPTSSPPASRRPERSSTASAPATAPARPTRPVQAPQASPVAKYMAAASTARNIQDPVQRAAQMAKVRDMGMDIWKAKYKDTLAKNVSPTGRQIGSGQSEMAKQADELRKLRPAPQAPGSEKPGYYGPPTPVAPQAQSRLSGGATYSPAATKLMTQRTKNILGVKEQYDAFNLVLEYLLSQGHVETLDEALYVMMQMDAECIHSIVENVQGSPVKLKPKSGLGGGVPVYEKGQEPKPPSGVQLPKLPPV